MLYLIFSSILKVEMMEVFVGMLQKHEKELCLKQI